MEEVARLEGHFDRVWCVAWSPDGSVVATCSGDQTVLLWGKQGDKWVVTNSLRHAHSGTVRSVAWSPCGRYLTSAGFDRAVAVYNHHAGAFDHSTTLEGHDSEVKGVAWDASSTLLASCSRDKSIWLWEAVEAEFDTDMGDADLTEFECVAVLHGHSQDVKCVVWHPHERVLASGSYDDSIKIWQEDDEWYCTQTLCEHKSTVWSLAFDASGERLVSCSDDHTLIIWKFVSPLGSEGRAARQWSRVCIIQGHHSRPLYSVDWCHKSGMIVCGGGDDSIELIQRDNVAQALEHDESYSVVLSKKRAHASDVNCVRWNPADPSLLASCGDDNVVKLWRFVGL